MYHHSDWEEQVYISSAHSSVYALEKFELLQQEKTYFNKVLS